MNKQGPGKIDWTDYTWNPISGCKHGCPYCYVAAMDRRFGSELMTPRHHTERIADPCRKRTPAKIFVGSSGDMWGDWVPSEWISDVLDVCEVMAPQHTYQFLTKNPHRYGQFSLPKNGWYGTTVDGTDRTKNNIEDLQIATNGHCKLTRFISFEPLQKPVKPDLAGISWVIIGADSTRGADKPPIVWADEIIFRAREVGAAVWIKDNYHHPVVVKEWP